MRSPLARISRARFIVCAAVCLATLLAPARSFATHWIVDQNGAGDFTTIQAAIDANYDATRDSILVMPGDYDEVVGGTFPGWQMDIVGVGGALSTRVRRISEFWGAFVEVIGFSFTDQVSGYGNTSNFRLRRCVFLSSVSMYSPGGLACLEDCDFYGRTDLSGFRSAPPFRKLRFHGAPLNAHNAGSGNSYFEDCTFEGPADTLVRIFNLDDPDSFLRCRFANAGTGLLCAFEDGLGTLSVTNCTFQDLSVAGIRLDEEVPHLREAGILVGGCRFERCGTAIRWMTAAAHKWDGPYLFGDTILASIGNGVEIGRFGSSIANTIVDGSGGHGIAYYQTDTSGADDVDESSGASISGSWITNNSGDGVHIEDAGAPAEYQVPRPREVIDCWLAFNGGAGARVTSKYWRVSGCRSYANGGDGFACTTALPGLPSVAYSNTSVLNRRDGFRLTSPPYPADSLMLVQHNLAALNLGTGIRVPQQSSGSVSFNDAWNNYGSQYFGQPGLADSNLTVDPRFCGLGAGNLGLQQGSPVGAGGIYGLIGALPEQCPNTTVVEPAAPRLSFSVRPSVARGSVEFLPPSTGPDGRVEIFDVSGRRHWGAVFGPTTGALHWTGQSETGHAQPGLYWVRFTRAGETQSQRLVWLR